MYLLIRRCWICLFWTYATFRLLRNVEEIEGSITKDWRWPLDIVLKILRLSDSGNCVMSINDQGLLQIIVDSGIGKYTYLLPARS